MNFLFLSPHFPPSYDRFCYHLWREGVNVLGIADHPAKYLSPYLHRSLKDYVVADLHHYETLIRTCGYFTHCHGKLDRIESLNEYWLETEAGLRTDFNVQGIKRDAIDRVKCKSRMKEVFASADIAYARGEVIHSLTEGQIFIEKVGYPVVVKPDKGVGAAYTYKLQNENDLQSYFQQLSEQPIIMEEFVDGIILAFDGLTDKSGHPVFYTAHQYSQGVMDVVNTDNHVYYFSLRDIPSDLEEAGLNLLRAFDVRERFFHFEFFRTPDDRLVALEVNMRPPGGLTLDMFNYANDIDIYKEYAHVVVHNKFHASYDRKYHCCYVGRKFNKSYAHTHQQIIDAYGYCIVAHQALPPLFQKAMGNYSYLVRSPDLEEMLTVTHYIQELV